VPEPTPSAVTLEIEVALRGGGVQSAAVAAPGRRGERVDWTPPSTAPTIGRVTAGRATSHRPGRSGLGAAALVAGGLQREARDEPTREHAGREPGRDENGNSRDVRAVAREAGR
jgi:hypothetical protein